MDGGTLGIAYRPPRSEIGHSKVSMDRDQNVSEPLCDKREVRIPAIPFYGYSEQESVLHWSAPIFRLLVTRYNKE
jgi:hypothetical protein